MKPQEMRSQLSQISQSLNTDRQDNDIRIIVEKILVSVRNSSNESIQDVVQEKRKKNLTNHEKATSDHPLPQQIDGDAVQNIEIPRKQIEKLTTNLIETRKHLSSLSDGVEEIDIDEFSSSMTRVKEQVHGMLDDFEYSLFTRGNQPSFRKHAEMINHKASVNDEDMEELEDSLERIINECSYVSRNLREIDIPDMETVKEEADKTRAERARQEYEEIKPFQDMRQLQRHFNIGEVFTPEELAEKVDVWSDSTSKSCIEDAMQVAGTGSYPDIEKVAGDTYKMVENQD